MVEYIDRNMIYEYIERFYSCHSENIVFTKELLQFFISKFPTADVAPICHGHWIRQDSIVPYYECSECHCSIDQEPHYNYSDNIMRFPKYCEHCGAKMDEKECNSK